MWLLAYLDHFLTGNGFIDYRAEIGRDLLIVMVLELPLNQTPLEFTVQYTRLSQLAIIIGQTMAILQSAISDAESWSGGSGSNKNWLQCRSGYKSCCR
jgi:hypothetical protein